MNTRYTMLAYRRDDNKIFRSLQSPMKKCALALEYHNDVIKHAKNFLCENKQYGRVEVTRNVIDCFGKSINFNVYYIK